MKYLALAGVALLAISAAAQQPAPAAPSRTNNFSTNLAADDDGLTYSDLNCAGFITKENISTANQVAAGENSPNQTLYAGRNTLLVSGSGYQEGQRYSVIRALRDPNRYEPYKGQWHDVAEAGQPYAQLGRVRIDAIRGETAIAEVEFSCQSITAGDILIPYKEPTPVTLKKASNLERFPAGPGKLGARIVMGNEFDFLNGRGSKVYINAGSDKGVKVGDYFRAVRGYDPAKMDPVEAVSLKAPVAEDTQKYSAKLSGDQAAKLPVRNLGEMVVINVTPTSSTALITNNVEPIEVGDHVELEEQ